MRLLPFSVDIPEEITEEMWFFLWVRQ